MDYNFAGAWYQADADNTEIFMMRSGYVITCAIFPVLLCSKLQTEIALSKTEAEYIVLSQAMRNVITFMVLVK